MQSLKTDKAGQGRAKDLALGHKVFKHDIACMNKYKKLNLSTLNLILCQLNVSELYIQSSQINLL